MSTCFFEELVRTGQIAPLYLIVGPFIQAKEAAMLFASLLLQEPVDSSFDHFVFVPDGQNTLYMLEPLRELVRQLQTPPFRAPYKVCCVEEAQRIPPLFADTLLKILEEPIVPSVTLLLTHQASLLPATLRSRAVTLPLKREEERSSLPPALLDRLQALITKLPTLPPHALLHTAQELGGQLDRQQALTCLPLFLRAFPSESTLDAINQAKLLIERSQNPTAALEGLCLRLSKI